MATPSKRARRTPSLLTAALLLAAMLGLWLVASHNATEPGPVSVTLRWVNYERWARGQFMRAHPGEEPLNWAIARAAGRFYRTEPMGKFVLAVEPGQWGNDCSDFVACAVDEGLGAQARFRRGSRSHALSRVDGLMEVFHWDPSVVVQPGDIVSVRHSPWYAPYPEACWHVGVVGPEGEVYDFTKLKRWPRARYGRSEFGWFVRHSRAPRQVLIRRLAPRYRYRIEPIPAGSAEET